jgi:RND family efflux transporter MFP subunit
VRTIRLAAIGLAVAALSSSCSGCRKADTEMVVTGQAVPVRVNPARLGTITDTLTASGTVVPAAGADWIINAPEPGIVAELPKAEGDPVAVGDIVVRFEVPSINQELASKQADLAMATSKVRAAQAELDKMNGLDKQGFVSRNDVDNARRAVTDAQAAENLAKASLDAAKIASERTIVRAKFAGKIAQVFKKAGETIDSIADPVVRVIDPARVQVKLILSAAEIARVNAGQQAIIRPQGAPEEAGIITTRPMLADPTQTQGDARVNFVSPTSLPLDSPVEVELMLEERANAVLVPRNAVLKDDDGSYVMVAGSDDKAHRREVKVGLTSHDLAQILSGVEVNDKVIVSGLDQIAEGAAISVER